MNIKKIVCVIGMILASPFTYAEQLQAVICNGAQSRETSTEVFLIRCPGVPIEKDYMIKCSYYWLDKENIDKDMRKAGKANYTLPVDYLSFNDESFLKNLETAKLLYFGQKGGVTPYYVLSKYSEECKKFLAGGGTIFIDFFGGYLPDLTPFLQSVGVFNPCNTWDDYKTNFIPGDYTAKVTEKYQDSPILNTPWKIKEAGAHGWWITWNDKQIIPFQNPLYPGKSATMIIQENVMGKGKVIFNQLPFIFRGANESGDQKLLENTLTYIFGEDILKYRDKMIESQGGPGSPVK